jgi:GlcNAc-PI de-N-acetylase
MAHPDDVEFSCAAAIAQWVSEGCDVHYLLGTCGEAGMEDPEWTPERTARARKDEQRRAAEMVGVDSVEFLDYPDGRIMYGELLRRDLARAIRRCSGSPTVSSQVCRSQSSAKKSLAAALRSTQRSVTDVSLPYPTTHANSATAPARGTMALPLDATPLTFPAMAVAAPARSAPGSPSTSSQ